MHEHTGITIVYESYSIINDACVLIDCEMSPHVQFQLVYQKSPKLLTNQIQLKNPNLSIWPTLRAVTLHNMTMTVTGWAQTQCF